MDKYDFRTEQFGLNSEGIYLLRSGYCYKHIKPVEIDFILIKNGIRVKNRIGLLAFGLINFIAATYLLLIVIPLDSLGDFGVHGGRWVWAVIMVILFLFGMSLASFYLTLIPTKVFKFRTKTDYWNVFSLNKTSKKEDMDRLFNVLNNSPFNSMTDILI